MAGIPEVPRETDLRSKRDKIMTMDDVDREAKVKQEMRYQATWIAILARAEAEELHILAEKYRIPDDPTKWNDDGYPDNIDNLIANIVEKLR